MTRTQIDCFLEVSKCLSFSRAAANLYVSQPAVSKQVSLMEAEFGLSLFDRSDKVVRLTEAGVALRNFLLRSDRDLEALLFRLKNSTPSAYRGSILLGCRATWDAMTFYRDMSHHFASWPEISISPVGCELGELIPLLRAGEIDFALTYAKSAEKQSDLLAVPFAQPGLELLYSADIPSGASMTLQDFIDRDFLTVDNYIGDFIQRHTAALCANFGFHPRFRRCKSMSSALMEVNCNRGVMVIDKWEIVRTNSAYRCLPLSGNIPIDLVCLSRNLTPLKEFFISEIQSRSQNEPWLSGLSPVRE